MPIDQEARRPAPADVEAWLGDLGLAPGPRTDRDGISAWDISLDGRRRRDLRTTLILDPGLGLIVWAHLAPPLGDGLRKAYRSLLQWNDQFPLAKFSLADDGRPILAVELPARWLDRDELGLALARVAGIADRLFEETRPWVWIGGRVPDGYAARECRTAGAHRTASPRACRSCSRDEPRPDPCPAGRGASAAPRRGGRSSPRAARSSGRRAARPRCDAAMPALILVTATTYEVLPDEGRVAVTVRISATNRLRDTVTRRYFYEEGALAVLPESLQLPADGGVGVAERHRHVPERDAAPTCASGSGRGSRRARPWTSR